MDWAPVVVVGLGNPLRRDDALGIAVARELAGRTGARVASGPLRNLELLDHVAGGERLIVVDATWTGVDAPGTVRRIELGDGARAELRGGRHGLGIAEVLALGRRIGIAVPARAIAYTMEAAELSVWGEGLSEPVARALPGMVERILGEEFGERAGEPAVRKG